MCYSTFNATISYYRTLLQALVNDLVEQNQLFYFIFKHFFRYKIFNL
jgi:hypothetical protein